MHNEYDPIYEAYATLRDAILEQNTTKEALEEAITTAIGYLGEALS